MVSLPSTNTTAKTEKQKMLDGELYQAMEDPELVRERLQAKQVCFELNQTPPMDVERRRELVKKLLGGGGGDLEDAVIESPFHVDYGYNLRVGKCFYANHGCTVLDCNRIVIGDNCFLAPHVVITAAFHPLNAALRVAGDELAAPITIGDNCWIGANATINPGVVIGDNVVIGSGAVVTRNVPDNVVVAGVPARVIRYVDQNDNKV